MKTLFIVFCTLSLAACSTTRSVVAMKVNEEEAHIALGEKDVKVGDRVALYKNECEQIPLRYSGLGKNPICHKVNIGGGVVTKTLGIDYSAIRLDPGVNYDEGVTVEKQ